MIATDKLRAADVAPGAVFPHAHRKLRREDFGVFEEVTASGTEFK